MGASIWGVGGSYTISPTSLPAVQTSTAWNQYNKDVADTQAMRQAEIARTNAEAARLDPAHNDPYLRGLYDKYEAERQTALEAQKSRYESALAGYQGIASQQSAAIAGVPGQYQDIANAYGQRTSDLSQYLTGLGDTQKQELADQYQQLLAGQQQSLANRGLYNSSMYDSAQQGALGNYAKQLTGLNESLNRQKMDYMSALTGEALQAQQLVPQSTLEVAKQQAGYQAMPFEYQGSYQENTPTLPEISQITKTMGIQ